jgi:hypothetical protein
MPEQSMSIADAEEKLISHIPKVWDDDIGILVVLLLPLSYIPCSCPIDKSLDHHWKSCGCGMSVLASSWLMRHLREFDFFLSGTCKGFSGCA